MSRYGLSQSALRVFALAAVSGSFWGLGGGGAAPAYATPGRAYELVSPADKGGQPVFVSPTGRAIGLVRAAQDGDGATFTSWGIFGDAVGGLPVTYRSRRTSLGWATTAVSPGPSTASPDIFTGKMSAWSESSRNLDVGVIKTRDAHDSTDDDGGNDVYKTGGSAPVLVSRGNGSERTGVAGIDGNPVSSSDGSRIVFQTRAHLVPEDSARVAGTEVYERIADETRVVNEIDQTGAPINVCGSLLGAGSSTDRNAISSDGRRINITVPAGGGASPDCVVPAEIYQRVDGVRTIHVSRSQRDPVDPAGARPKAYLGASADGDRVFFSSGERLSGSAPDRSGVYRYTVSTGALDLLLPTGLAPASVSKISADGSTIYFISLEALTPEAVAGRRNLYVHRDGAVKHVATDQPGTVLQTDIVGASEAVRRAVVTPSGGHFLFSTAARLTDFDTRGRAQVYLYRFAEDELVCVSCDPSGQRPSASGVTGDSVISLPAGPLGTTYMDDQAPPITADGSTVVLASADRLIAADTNRAVDIYEYRDGELSLVTTGRATSDASLIGMAADGRDVFFVTYDSLVPQDVDGGNLDLYTARLGGGFPYDSPPVPTPCLGDACQAGPTPAPQFEIPGTETFNGQVPDDEEPPALVDRRLRLLRISSASKNRFNRTGRLPLKVRVTGGGTVRATLHARIGRRNRLVGATRVAVSTQRATTKTVAVRLNALGQRALRRGAIRVRVSVSLSGMQEARATVTLRRGRA